MMTMIFVMVTIFMFSASVCVSGLEATEGEDVTIPFKIPELLKADKARILQTRRGNQKSLVARLCFQQEGCYPLNRPGVMLRVEGETLSLTLQNVSCSRDSGRYEVEVFNGKYFEKKNVTLIVHPLILSTPPHQVQPSKPPNFSERQRIFVLIPLVFSLVVALVGCLIFRKHQTAQRPHNRKSAAV